MMLVLFAIGTSLLAVASTADSAAAVTQRADHERSDHELYGWNTNHGREKRQEGKLEAYRSLEGIKGTGNY